jgi:hypothetical protein
MISRLVEEAHKLSHYDEMRYKILLRGMQTMLKQKKEQKLYQRILKRRKKLTASSWK